MLHSIEPPGNRTGVRSSMIVCLFLAGATLCALAESPVFDVEGVMLIPSRLVEDHFEPLPSAQLQGHLVSILDPNIEYVFPSSQPFQAPAGVYRAWVSGEWRISPFSMIVSSSGRAGRGVRGPVPVGPAGRVLLPPKEPRSKHLVLRLLYAGDYLAANIPMAELTRRVSSLEAEEGVLMPVGTNVAALWDERKSKYVALTRPFEVPARERIVASLERPGEKAFFIAQLLRHERARNPRDYDTEVVLVIGDSEMPPKLKVSTSSRIYAFWYDLPPGRAELQAGSEHSWLEPEEIDLKAGKIGSVLSRLQPPLGLEEKSDDR